MRTRWVMRSAEEGQWETTATYTAAEAARFPHAIPVRRIYESFVMRMWQRMLRKFR